MGIGAVAALNGNNGRVPAIIDEQTHKHEEQNIGERVDNGFGSWREKVEHHVHDNVSVVFETVSAGEHTAIAEEENRGVICPEGRPLEEVAHEVKRITLAQLSPALGLANS